MTLRPLAALAQAPVPPRAGPSLVDLSRLVTDPAGPLMSFTFASTTSSIWNVNDSRHVFTARPIVPVALWGKAHLFRVVVPYRTAGPGGPALQPVQIVDVAVTQKSWGRWSLGAVANVSPSALPGADSFTFGPAFGVGRKLGIHNAGVFVQNLFGGNSAVTLIQPVWGVQLGNGWAFSAGELVYGIDWENSRITQAPLGFQFGKVFRAGAQPMRLFVTPSYNVKRLPTSNKWAVAAGVMILAPRVP